MEDGVRKCVSCAEEMEMVKCPAEKFAGMSEDSHFVLIKHTGNHKCLHKSVLETQVLEEMETYFELNPTSTRSEAIIHHLISKISFGTKEEVIDLVSISLNLWEINNAKVRGIRRLNPHGNKMEAVRHLKAKLEEIGNPYSIILKVFDDIYICSMCNKINESSENKDCEKICANCYMTPMEHIGPAVFISSRESLSTLRELSANGLLETEACCLDHQPSRLRQYTTFASYAYDVDLRRMCPLFASVMCSEKELAVYHCLDIVDRCLAEEFGKGCKFDPNLIIADEASAIKNAVARKLGKEEMLRRYGTCQLHYQGSILQHCGKTIGSNIEIFQFMKLSESLMNCETPQLYELFKAEMVKFISQTEQRYEYLIHWFEFYDARKVGWAKAFRNAELPKTNKGEAGNAHYSAVTHLTELTLDLGVKAMLAEFHVYAGCKRGIVSGLYRGGNGPSRVAMENKMVQETFQRIQNTPLTSKGSEEFVSKVLKQIGLKETDKTGQEPVMRQRSQFKTHQFLAEEMRARTEARVSAPSFENTPHKAPKKTLKRRIQFSDTLADVQNDNPKPKKKATGQKARGESFNTKVLQTLSEGVGVIANEAGVYQLTINNDAERCYTVNLKENPTCTCPHFVKIEQSRPFDRNTLVCKHISAMMLFLGFTYRSKIIRKCTYNSSDSIVLTEKIEAFSHTNLDVSEIKRQFEKGMNPTLEESPKLQTLPYFNPKKYYGHYKNYQEAKVFIDERREGYPCKWYAVSYTQMRFTCASASHTTAGSNKLIQSKTQARPLVFLVYFTKIFMNINTGKYLAKDERKYFHMQPQCIADFGQDLMRFSNIKPPFDVDITRLSPSQRAIFKNTFPDVTFVE